MSRRSRAVLAFATLLVAWVAGGSVAHAASWVPGPTLTESVLQAPRIALGADGAATVLWADGAPGASPGDVAVRRVAANGTPGGVHGLGAGAALDVVATGGGARLAWATVAAGGTSLAVRTRDLSHDDVTSGSRTVDVPTGSAAREPLGAIAPDGALVVTWLEDSPVLPDTLALKARRIAADGTLGPVSDYGLAVEDEASYQLGIGSDGVARVVWRRPDVVGGGLLVARIDTDGTSSAPTILTMDPESVATLEVDGEHAIAGWFEALTPGDPGSLSAVRAKRLPSSGAVAGPQTTIVPSLASTFRGVGFALAADGTATVAWSETDVESMTGVVNARRLAPSGALGAVQRVSGPPAAGAGVSLTVMPTLANAPDGTAVAAWMRVAMPAMVPVIVSRRIGVDGVPVGGELPVPFAAGSALSMGTFTLTGGPTPDAFLTATGISPASVPTLLTSRLVVPPPVVVDPPTPVDPGPGPGAPPGPGATPVPTPSAPTVRRASSRIKLTKATRKGGRVSVAGTIDRRADGRVTMTWRQKAGRRTITRTSRVRIAKGRFATTLKLPATLARSKAAGRLKVSFAGNAAVAGGTVERTVRPAKAKAKKRS